MTTRLGSDAASASRKPNQLPLSTLTAVALQDHISRQLSLSPLPPLHWGCRRCGKNTARTRAGRAQTQPSEPQLGRISQSTTAGRCTGSEAHVRRSRRQQPPSDGGNSLRTDTTLCSEARADKRHRPGECTQTDRPSEYVLDPAPPPLSLAQRLGLVEAPPPLLSEPQWGRVKASSNARLDSALPCPICQEDFGLREQVLLSCSHVFHRACLQAFERHSRRKCCPLCRHRDYQTRVIFEGAQCHRNNAATRIQAAWRGHVVRKWYRALRERLPPKDPRLRRRHFEEKLSSLTERMVRSCAHCSSGAEQVLAQADMAVANSRDIMRLVELHSQFTNSTIDWKDIRSRAQDQLSSDCPVCLAPLQTSSLPPRPLSLLSCGHVLHLVCIQSLEQYSLNTIHTCPLCRTPYQRQHHTHLSPL